MFSDEMNEEWSVATGGDSSAIFKKDLLPETIAQKNPGRLKRMVLILFLAWIVKFHLKG